MLKTLKFAPFALLVSVLCACGGDKAETAPTTESKPKASTQSNLPVYKVGIDTPYPPFIQLGENGAYQGFDVDLLKEIGGREGFDVIYEPRKWDGIFNLLDSGELDLVASGAFDTPERRKRYALSDPYHSETMVLITKKDSTIKSFGEVQGKEVAYIPGSVGADILLAIEGGKELKPSLAKENSAQVIKSIIQQDTELAIDTSSAYAYYSKQHPEQGLRVIYQDNPEWLDIVFVAKQDNAELIGKLNKGLAAIKSDGTYDKIKDKWFTSIAQAPAPSN